MYFNKKISNIGLEEISVFRQLVPLVMGIVFLILMMVLNAYSKKRYRSNLLYIQEHPFLNVSEPDLVVNEKIEVVKDHLFIAIGAGQLHYLRDYDDYTFTVNRHNGIVTGFKLTLKNTNTGKTESVVLPKLKDEQINALLNTLNNNYYP